MKKILFLLAILLIIFGIVYVQSYLNKKNVTNIQSHAQAICNDSCLKPDPCCQQMVDKQDYTLCKWADPRGYCPLSFCNQLPPGLEGRGHCGWYWSFHDANGNQYHIGTNTSQGYGCMIGPDENHMTPICGGGTSNPTSTPAVNYPTPTRTPRPTRTATPALEPTSPEFLFPTNSVSSTPTPGTIIPFLPTGGPQQPLITPTPLNSGSFSLYLPDLRPILGGINILARQPLDILEAIFNTTVHYDRLLENAINSKFPKKF